MFMAKLDDTSLNIFYGNLFAAVAYSAVLMSNSKLEVKVSQLISKHVIH